MEVKKRETTEGIDVYLNGVLGIECVVDLRGVVLDSLHRFDTLALDCGAVTGAHVAVLQLLCAAHRYAAEQQKSFCITRISDQLRTIVRQAGFERHDGCWPDEQQCLWKEDVSGGKDDYDG